MRKLILLAAVAFLLVACGGAEENNESEQQEDVIGIGQRFFIQQMAEIHMNASLYMGRAIRYEGMFWNVECPFTGVDRHFVVRFASACCGGGGAIGFEIEMGYLAPFPDDAWVEITGILGECETDGFLYLAAISVIELEERGEEVVFG